MLIIWSLVSLPFLKLEVHGSCTVEAWLGEFWALLYYFVRWVQLCGSLSILWHCLSLGLEWNLTFPSSEATAEFSRCWHIDCRTFTASSFRIWNSSAGIPSLPLALFILMLPKAHLTLHSRMFGSKWVITPSWLSGLWRSFLYSSSVYSCYLFLISSASFRSIPLLSLIMPIFVWNVLLVSLIFLKRSLIFPVLLFFSISLQWSLRKAFLSLLAVLWNSAVSGYIFVFLLCLSHLFYSQLVVRPPQKTILPFCISFS